MDMISIVLLLLNPLPMDVSRLEVSIARAAPASFVKSEQNFVNSTDKREKFEVFFAKSNDGIFLVHNHAHPYCDELEKVAGSISDRALGEKVRKHRAWISVDLMDRDKMMFRTEADAWRFIGKVLAELAPEDAVAIYVPAKGVLMAFDNSSKTKLRDSNVLKALGF